VKPSPSFPRWWRVDLRRRSADVADAAQRIMKKNAQLNATVTSSANATARTPAASVAAAAVSTKVFFIIVFQT